MLFLLEIGLFVFGVWLLTRTVLRVGTYELRAPQTIFAGLILAIQLPMAVGLGIAIGGAEGIKARREGLDPSVATSKIAKKYSWMDLATCGTALALAGAVALHGFRPICYEPPPPDEPVGITDHRTVMAGKWAENDRLARTRQRRQATFDEDDGRDEPQEAEDRHRVQARIGD